MCLLGVLKGTQEQTGGEKGGVCGREQQRASSRGGVGSPAGRRTGAQLEGGRADRAVSRGKLCLLVQEKDDLKWGGREGESQWDTVKGAGMRMHCRHNWRPCKGRRERGTGHSRWGARVRTEGVLVPR